LFACHPVEVLPILKSINPAMQSALKKFSREKNIAYTHFDSKQMPKERNVGVAGTIFIEKERSPIGLQ
jgi:predicted NAD/FAD-binding protein